MEKLIKLLKKYSSNDPGVSISLYDDYSGKISKTINGEIIRFVDWDNKDQLVEILKKEGIE